VSGQAKPRVVRSCWAAGLGGCGDGISQEHVISRGILDGLPLERRAIHFGAGGPVPTKSLGNDNFTLPILCRAHNSQLSALDAEAKRFFRGLEAILSRPLGKTGFDTESGQAVLACHGSLFERWAAKTFLNAVLADVALRPDKTPPLGVTGGGILRQVFEGAPFEGRQGLWGLPVGSRLLSSDRTERTFLAISPIMKQASVWQAATQTWTEFYDLPVGLHIRTHGLELVLVANITSIDNSQWESLVSDELNYINGLNGRRHPECVGLTVPDLDAHWPQDVAPRLAGFRW